MNIFDLTGKVAVVTGGLNGNLGPIWTETLREAGADVFVVDLPEYDITSGESVKKAFHDCWTSVGFPDILVNNAAIDNPPGSGASFWSNYHQIMDVNLSGAIRVIQAFMPMTTKKERVIINIGSIQGEGGADWRNYVGNFEKPIAYNLSKAGLKHLSKCLTTQYGRYGIRSVTIAFAAVESDKYTEPFKSNFLRCLPMGRFISKKSLQTTLLYACCCPELAGQTVIVDGGYCSW